MYHHELIEDIECYINNEIKSSMFYSELAKKAPSTLVKEILTKFSLDEKNHAENFKQAYYYLTGKACEPQTIENQPIPDFFEALKTRLAAETMEYKIYGQHYIEASNKYLKHLFFSAKTVEAEHAMRIPMLLEELKE